MVVQVDEEALAELRPALRQALESSLAEDEELLWFDHPHLWEKRFKKFIFRLCYSLVTACVIGISAMAIWGLLLGGYDRDKSHLCIIVLAIVATLTLCGIFTLSAIFAYRERTKPLYVLTNSRAIIISPRLLFCCKPKATSYALDTELVKSVKIKGNKGDIVFEEKEVPYYVTINGVTTRRVYIRKLGFLRCPNAKAVAEYIHECTHRAS